MLIKYLKSFSRESNYSQDEFESVKFVSTSLWQIIEFNENPLTRYHSNT